MLYEVTAEIFKLTRDLTFVRNFSLTSILAIACLFSLSDLQNQSTPLTERAVITNISSSTSITILVKH